jgi:hypothetical protein
VEKAITMYGYDLIEYSRGGKRKVKVKRRPVAKKKKETYPQFALRGKGAKNTWVASAIHATVKSGDIAVSLTQGVEIAVINNSALKHIYRNRQAFLTALYASTAGATVKQAGGALGAGTVLVPSGVALAAPVFGGVFGAAATLGTVVGGWRAHLTSSVVNNAYRPFQVDIGPIVGAAGAQTMPAPVLSLLIYTRTPAADIIVWSPQNGAGQFSLSPGNMNAAVLDGATTPTNGIVCRTLDANTYAQFESINMRDIYPRFGACPPASDEAVSDYDLDLDLDDDYDEDYDDGENLDAVVPTNRQGWRGNRAHPALRDAW